LSSHRGRAERFCDLDNGELFASGQFAAVIGTDFSYFVSELDRFAHEAFRVLRPGGQLLFAAVCPVSANDVVDSLVCGPFMRVPERIVRLLTGAGFGFVETEDWTPGYTEVVGKYLAATHDRIVVLRDAIGSDAVNSWIKEFTVEQELLKNARIVRLLFRAKKGPDPG
jgi:SAM-dependent methyltransferase